MDIFIIVKTPGFTFGEYNVVMVRVDHVLESWKAVRQDTVGALEDLPSEELDYRPTPELMTFRELARHILDAGHAFCGLLLAGEDDLATPDFREKLKQHLPGVAADAGRDTLAAALRDSIERRTAELATRPPEFFAHLITRFDGQRVTRLEMLQFLKEHELTHRSQMFTYLRLKGIVPATTRRRLAKQAGK
jgi:uncharacterized damage-inducible protein DinB